MISQTAARGNLNIIILMETFFKICCVKKAFQLLNLFLLNNPRTIARLFRTVGVKKYFIYCHRCQILKALNSFCSLSFVNLTNVDEYS